MIRDAVPDDFPAILRLNLECEHLLAPMDLELLSALHGWSAYHRVVCLEGKVVAFLIALREGSGYDSLNYAWFTARYPAFLYIDRVAVSPEHQGKGLGPELYRDLLQFARSSEVPRLTCEFYTVPMNAGSSKFHARFGFEEVGVQWVAQGKKKVSLQELRVEAIAADR